MFCGGAVREVPLILEHFIIEPEIVSNLSQEKNGSDEDAKIPHNLQLFSMNNRLITVYFQ